jgi:hypothetical protein
VTDTALKDRYTGEKFTVVHCEGAKDSFDEAMNSVEKRKHKSFTRGVIQQIERLAKGQRMSKENFPQEGDLPKRVGQAKAKKFNALKRIPLRGYCWLSETKPHTYFISHYIYKDQKKLKSADTERVGANWRRIEEQGDEC